MDVVREVDVGEAKLEVQVRVEVKHRCPKCNHVQDVFSNLHSVLSRPDGPTPPPPPAVFVRKSNVNSAAGGGAGGGGGGGGGGGPHHSGSLALLSSLKCGKCGSNTLRFPTSHVPKIREKLSDTLGSLVPNPSPALQVGCLAPPLRLVNQAMKDATPSSTHRPRMVLVLPSVLVPTHRRVLDDVIVAVNKLSAEPDSMIDFGKGFFKDIVDRVAKTVIGEGAAVEEPGFSRKFAFLCVSGDVPCPAVKDIHSRIRFFSCFRTTFAHDYGLKGEDGLCVPALVGLGTDNTLLYLELCQPGEVPNVRAAFRALRRPGGSDSSRDGTTPGSGSGSRDGEEDALPSARAAGSAGGGVGGVDVPMEKLVVVLAETMQTQQEILYSLGHLERQAVEAGAGLEEDERQRILAELQVRFMHSATEAETIVFARHAVDKMGVARALQRYKGAPEVVEVLGDMQRMNRVWAGLPPTDTPVPEWLTAPRLADIVAKLTPVMVACQRKVRDQHPGVPVQSTEFAKLWNAEIKGACDEVLRAHGLSRDELEAGLFKLSEDVGLRGAIYSQQQQLSEVFSQS